MVWAGICHDGHTQLKIVQETLNAVKYKDDILDPIVLPFLQQPNFDHVFQHDNARSGADPGFQVRGGALKKIAPSGGRRENFGVFRVKNHDFTPKNHIFPILGGAREIFGVFHVKNHDFTPKKIIFFPILGGARAGCPP